MLTVCCARVCGNNIAIHSGLFLSFLGSVLFQVCHTRNRPAAALRVCDDDSAAGAGPISPTRLADLKFSNKKKCDPSRAHTDDLMISEVSVYVGRGGCRMYSQ